MNVIRASELKPTENPGYRLLGEDALAINLQMIKKRILDINEESYGLPIEIREDQIKSGGMFNSSVDPCLLVINTKYRADYFGYAIMLKKQGKTATVDLHYWGTSKWTGRANEVERRKKTGGLGGALLNIAFSVNEKEMQAEYEYYSMLEEIFTTVFS